MDERKLKILAAVVDEYVRTGEPVGSKSISKLENINVSSATIRNDMAALEQLGYLPPTGTVFIKDRNLFTAEDVSGRRIISVRVKKSN